MRHKVNHQQMAEGNPEKPKRPTKKLSDSDTPDEEQIPSSALATQIALSHSRAQANPTVERGPSHKVRVVT